jgi:hypothetical protein
VTPTASNFSDPTPTPPLLERGTPAYHTHALGGTRALAQLYLDAGLLHLDGAAPTLLMSSSAAVSLSSIRLPAQGSPPQSWAVRSGSADGAWRRDRANARRCFERARTLWPELDIPVLSATEEDEVPASDAIVTGVPQLQMPRIDVHAPPGGNEQPSSRRRRKATKESSKETELDDNALSSSVTSLKDDLEDDHNWVLFIPGLIGAGTALVAVAVVGALSFSSWRRNQN